MSLSYKKTVENLLREADIQINGSRAWDIQVHDERVYAHTLEYGSLGFGEAYMNGWWDCEAIDEMLTRMFRAHLDERVRGWRIALGVLKARIFNAQRPSKAFEIGERHYDIGNDLYEQMLDQRMVYTCGYWKNASTLDEAQEAKLDLVCKKIALEPGMRVLDIGCGWGSFAKFAAERYGARVTGITVSKAQVAFGNARCKGLPVELRLQDYREVTGSFDRVVSLGMFEHVGYKNYATFMKIVSGLLPDQGIFLLHTIGRNTPAHSNDPWIDKYIFPNSMLPSVDQIGLAFAGCFVMEDWHNFGIDYDKTLQAWHHNFESGWSVLSKNYDERFHRMWRFYLLSSAATFRARRNQLWQIVLSKDGVHGGHQRLN
mgnify:CR=1 FL=1